MVYVVKLKKQAEKYFKKASRDIRELLTNRFEKLEENPRGEFSQELKGDLSGYWKSRIGSLRIAFEINELEKIVDIHLIASRGEIYKKLKRFPRS